MSTDFDAEIPLRNIHSAKWDMHGPATGATGDDVIPMWVADMDFRAPQSVLDVMQAEIDRGVMGYYGNDVSLRQAIMNWYDQRHGWSLKPEWLYFSHGVVAGLGLVLEAFTKPGDGVVLFTPVYHAFAKVVRAKGRQVVESLLENRDGVYHMDLDALAGQLTGNEKMVIFCSPHNPGGRLWTGEEIRALCAFCAARDLILVSDEIHMDLLHPGATHHVTAVTCPDIAPNLITLSAASKTFNIAGGETSFIIAADPGIREKFAKAHAAYSGSNNRFGMLMMEAALNGGGAWLEEANAYIAENFALFRDRVNAIPGLRVMDMQSTYLAWVDFAGTGMPRQEFTDRVQQTAKIAVNQGPSFGSGGESFLRFNIATRRALVVEAVTRLEAAFADLQ